MFLKGKILVVLIVFSIITFILLTPSCSGDCGIGAGVVIGGLVYGLLIIGYILLFFINLFEKLQYFNNKIIEDSNRKKIKSKYLKLKLFQILLLFSIFFSYIFGYPYLLYTKFGAVFKYLDIIINNSLFFGKIRVFIILYILLLLLDINIFKKILFFNKNQIKRNIKKVIKDIDIDNIKNIKLKYNDGENYTINNKDLIKIIKYIINNTGKNQFKAFELQDFNNYILKIYKPSLKEENYNKNMNKLTQFIKNGGEIIVEYK